MSEEKTASQIVDLGDSVSIGGVILPKRGRPRRLRTAPEVKEAPDVYEVMAISPEMRASEKTMARLREALESLADYDPALLAVVAKEDETARKFATEHQVSVTAVKILAASELKRQSLAREMLKWKLSTVIAAITALGTVIGTIVKEG